MRHDGSGDTWSDDRVASLKKLWADGLSASQISTEIFGNTSHRNALIGKIHRLGLSGRARKTRATSTPRPRKPRAARPVRHEVERLRDDTTGELAPYLPPEVPNEIPLEQRRTLLQLTDSTCRWPYGDPATHDFFFCGAVPATGQPYCACHCAIAFDGAPAVKNYNPDNSRSTRPRLDAAGGL